LLLVVIDCFFCKPVWTLCLMSVLWWIFMSYFLKLSKSGMQQCHLQFLLCCWMVAVFCAKLTCAFNWTFVCIWRMCAYWHCDCTVQLWFFWLLIFALLLRIAVWFVYPFAPFPFQSLTFRFSCLLLFCFLFSVLFCVSSLSVSFLFHFCWRNWLGVAIYRRGAAACGAHWIVCLSLLYRLVCEEHGFVPKMHSNSYLSSVYFNSLYSITCCYSV